MTFPEWQETFFHLLSSHSVDLFRHSAEARAGRFICGRSNGEHLLTRLLRKLVYIMFNYPSRKTWISVESYKPRLTYVNRKVGVTGRSVAYCLCGYLQPFRGLLYGCNNNSNLHTSLLLFTCCPCLPHTTKAIRCTVRWWACRRRVNFPRENARQAPFMSKNCSKVYLVRIWPLDRDTCRKSCAKVTYSYSSSLLISKTRTLKQ